MDFIYDFGKFAVQLIAFFSVMILAYLAYDLISTSVRRWVFGKDDDDYGISLKFLAGSSSGDSGCGDGGCDEGECEWPCACDDVAVRKDRFYKELDAMAEAKERAEQEFWERREVLVELWEPKEGGGE